ncbi:putative antiporter subunit mnhC2 [Chlamydiales bacterium STE3]|nr:putative antiporter subunit mnhC2 [Chlamydiales bacterium STE3]
MDLTAVIIGIMVFCGTYLILQHRLSQMVLGFLLFSNAVNLLLLSMAQNPDEKVAPLVEGNHVSSYVDPIPQALILTAIVIGFAFIAHFMILCYRLFCDEKHEDLSELFRRKK